MTVLKSSHNAACSKKTIKGTKGYSEASGALNINAVNDVNSVEPQHECSVGPRY